MNGAIFFYSLENNKLTQVTSGYYNDTNPVFDPGGKYLYFLTDRNFSASYSSMDASWIYANSTQIAAATLHPSGKSLLLPKNDEVKVTATADTTAKPDDKKPKTEEPKDTKETKPANEPKPAASKDIKVNLDDFERRIEVLPLPAGNYGNINAVDGKLVYHAFSKYRCGWWKCQVFICMN